MDTNGTNDGGDTLQDLERALPQGIRGLAVIRRAEKGELRSADGRIAVAQYGDLLVITLLENGQLWVMEDGEAERALREARTFTPAETVALYHFFSQIALADISTMALMLAADRKPGETLDEQVAAILDGSRVPDEATLAQAEERYTQAYLDERYAWANRLLAIVTEYELEQHIDPKLRPAWEAALERAWPETVPATRAASLKPWPC